MAAAVCAFDALTEFYINSTSWRHKEEQQQRQQQEQHPRMNLLPGLAHIPLLAAVPGERHIKRPREQAGNAKRVTAYAYLKCSSDFYL